MRSLTHRLRPAGLLLALLLAAPSVAAQEVMRGLDIEAGARVALVIGNADYQHATALQNATNDARDIADALNAVGFSVSGYTDLTDEEMGQAVRSFAQDAAGADVALFYYAGHGVQVNGENYLLPVDADIATESQMRYNSLPLGEVMGILEDANPRFKMIFLDACRDNPFQTWRSSAGGWATPQGPTGSLISFATSPGDRASDNVSGRNGLFTQAFLENVYTPGLEVTAMMRRIYSRVMEMSDRTQEPWINSSYGDEFYFVPAEGDGPVVDPAPQSGISAVVLNARVDTALRRIEAGDSAGVVTVLRTAAEAGHAEAQSVLGWLLLRGDGVPADPATGLSWMRAAADLGHAGAQTNLGYAYETGLGVAADPAEAARLYRLAAAQGRPMAQHNLATLLQYGTGVPADVSEAARLYGLAAAQGLPVAQSALGALYETGTGVSADLERAADLYQQAALQGDALAMTRLGVLLHEGRGVAADAVRARDWLQRAAGLGETHAQAILASWAEQVPAEE